MDGWCCILIQDAENDRLSREARGNEIQRRIDQLYSTVTHPKSIVVAHRVSANSERCGYTPTSSKMSSQGGGRSLLVVYCFTSQLTVRVVPHGTKGTSPMVRHKTSVFEIP